MLQLVIVFLLVAESYHSIKAMGIGRFARKFPCSEKYCPLSAKVTGCTKAPIINEKQAERTPITIQPTTDHLTQQPLSNKTLMLNNSTINLVLQTSESGLKISTSYTTSKQGSDKSATNEYSISNTASFPPNMYATNTKGQGYTTAPILKYTKEEWTPTTTAPCPPNMVYAYCTIGQGTCQDPSNDTEICLESMTCVCPAGYLMMGIDCVPQEECECYFDGFGVIPNGEIIVNSDCTNRCECHLNVLTCNNKYRCSSAATCEERNGVRQCYCNIGYTGDGQNCEVKATDCADLYNDGITSSGVYMIKPTLWPGHPFQVYCNMTNGGGWTVFQRRIDGSQNFYLGWNMYKYGFGSPDRELWLGNDKLHYMTRSKNYRLRIDLTDKYGSPYCAKYDNFRINSEDDNYRLVGLGSFSGMQGKDALNKYRNSPFSTYDRDNDGNILYNCAYRHRGGWWYDSLFLESFPRCSRSEADCDYWQVVTGSVCGHCANSNLNGDYDSSTRGKSIHWTGLPGYDCNIIYTEMKIKPV